MMTSPFRRQHRLVSRGEAGLVCDGDGLALGTITLVSAEHGKGQARRYRARPASEIARILRLAYEGEAEATIARFGSGLGRVADLLEAGDIGRAGVQAVLLQLPPISPEGMAKLTALGDLCKAGPADEARLSTGQAGAGEWTSGGGGGGAPQDGRIVPTTDGVDPTRAKKTKFVHDHLVDALKGAKNLGVPVENILGLAALESGWGESRFALEASNFFGLYHHAPGEIGSIPANDGRSINDPKKVFIAKFKNFQSSLNSFIIVSGSIIKNESDPVKFAAALQNSGKFGIDPKTENKMPNYVHDVANTIRLLRPFIAASET